jgi:hypothetical protein
VVSCFRYSVQLVQSSRSHARRSMLSIRSQPAVSSRARKVATLGESTQQLGSTNTVSCSWASVDDQDGGASERHERRDTGRVPAYSGPTCTWICLFLNAVLTTTGCGTEGLKLEKQRVELENAKQELILVKRQLAEKVGGARSTKDSSTCYQITLPAQLTRV